jgi:hypothetical protein
MNVATKRAVIATAALAAAGLFGSLPFDGSSVAQQGVPTVHRDVALVDVTDASLLTDEGTYDTALVSDVSGAETTLYNDLSTSYGPTVANALLDTTTGGVGDFNGAETAGFDGLYLDGLVTEDELNQLVGVTSADSQAEIESLVAADPSAIPTGSDITLSDLVTAEGSSTFDTDLTSIANADYTLAWTDLEGYLTSLTADSSSLGDISTVLTDLSSSLSDVSTGLSTDLSTVLTDLGGLF